jgi:hypothetical protein
MLINLSLSFQNCPVESNLVNIFPPKNNKKIIKLLNIKDLYNTGPVLGYLYFIMAGVKLLLLLTLLFMNKMLTQNTNIHYLAFFTIHMLGACVCVHACMHTNMCRCMCLYISLCTCSCLPLFGTSEPINHQFSQHVI